jgi:hypothetical protein
LMLNRYPFSILQETRKKAFPSITTSAYRKTENRGFLKLKRFNRVKIKVLIMAFLVNCQGQKSLKWIDRIN